jgi:hypothetical protein
MRAQMLLRVLIIISPVGAIWLDLFLAGGGQSPGAAAPGQGVGLTEAQVCSPFFRLSGKDLFGGWSDDYGCRLRANTSKASADNGGEK